MEVCISATGQLGPDELRSLAVVLREGEAVAGAIGFAGKPLAADRLGPWLDMITVAVGAGGAVTVLIREVAHYLLRRTSDLELDVSHGPDGPSFRLSAKRLRVMSPDQVEEVIREAALALGAGSSPGPAPERAALSGPTAPDRTGQDREEGTGEETSR